MLSLPLAIQIVLEENYQETQKNLFAFFSKKGLRGVELNIPDPELVSVVELKAFLDEYALQMSMFASGLSAKVNQLSLSSADDDQRKKSIDKCLAYIDFAAAMGANGIIFGFIKGGVVAEPKRANDLFVDSLTQLAPEAEKNQVNLLVEATNRYESSIANSIADGVDLVERVGASAIKVLPDTFHMNIEEKDMYLALKENMKHFISLHLSDNNRLLPGHGAMDFQQLFAFLHENGFSGWLAMEGNMPNGIMEDTELALQHLHVSSSL